jgi:hypothetical protein
VIGGEQYGMAVQQVIQDSIVGNSPVRLGEVQEFRMIAR